MSSLTGTITGFPRIFTKSAIYLTARRSIFSHGGEHGKALEAKSGFKLEYSLFFITAITVQILHAVSIGMLLTIVCLLLILFVHLYKSKK